MALTPEEEAALNSAAADARQAALASNRTESKIVAIDNKISTALTDGSLKGDKGDAGPGVPAGGSTGQVLAKKSGGDFDTQWIDASGGGGAESDPIYTADKPNLATKSELDAVHEFSQRAILRTSFDTRDDLIAWTNVPDNMLLVREGTVLRVLDDASPDFEVVRDIVTGKFVPEPIEPLHAEKVEYNGGNVATALDNRPTKDVVTNSISSASSSTYSAVIAYVDEQIKTFDTLQLYIGATEITDIAPTGAGVNVSLDMTTTEKLWFERSYTIPGDGIVDKNVYDLLLPFDSVSTSRITICRAVWSVTTGGVEKVIFDKEFILQNTTGQYDYAGKFIREYPTDIAYNNGDVAKFRLYGRVSTGTDTATVLLGDANRTAVLNRSAPVAALPTTKMLDFHNGVEKSQAELNREYEAAISALEARITALESK